MKFREGDRVKELFTHKVGRIQEVKPADSRPYLVVFEDDNSKWDLFEEGQLLLILDDAPGT